MLAAQLDYRTAYNIDLAGTTVDYIHAEAGLIVPVPVGPAI